MLNQQNLFSQTTITLRAHYVSRDSTPSVDECNNGRCHQHFICGVSFHHQYSQAKYPKLGLSEPITGLFPRMQLALLLGIDTMAELSFEATKQKCEEHWSLCSAFSLCVVITFSPVGLQKREPAHYFSLRSYFMA